MILRGMRDNLIIDEPRPLDPERLARMAEAGVFMPELAEHCRRARRNRLIAKAAAILGAVAGAAWLVSDIAVAILLDEALLAALGIAP